MDRQCGASINFRNVGMLTVALRRAGVDWKIESLECPVFGLKQNQGAPSLTCEHGDDICMQAGEPGLPHQLRGAVILPRKALSITGGEHEGTNQTVPEQSSTYCMAR
eukprot:5107893-Pyramimonas_sp.AAC.1